MIENASFEKQTERAEGVSRKRGEESVTSQIRKGAPGDWENHIPSALAKMVDDSVSDLRARVFQKFNIEH